MVKLLLVFVPFFIGMVGVGATAYIVFRYMRVILTCLRESRIVTLFFEDFGYSRLMFSLILVGVVVFPGRHIAEGTLIPKELAAIPRSIVLGLRCAFWLQVLAMTSLLVVCLYGSTR